MIDVSVVLKVSCKKCIYHITKNRNTNLIRISSITSIFVYMLLLFVRIHIDYLIASGGL